MDIPVIDNLSNENQFPRHLLNIAATATIIILIAGIFGNLLTLYVLVKVRRLQTTTAIFLGSLATSDIILCSVVLPFEASKFIYGTWVHGTFLCRVIPLIRYGNVAISLTSLAMISWNRYLQIAQFGSENSKTFSKCHSSKTTVVAIILIIWLLCYGSVVPTFFGVWGRFGYDPLLNTCSINNDRFGRSPKKILFLIGFLVPCAIILFCYIKIFKIVRDSKKRLNQFYMPSIPPFTVSGTTTNKRPHDFRLTRMVFCIFFAFIVCYLPITISKLLDPRAQWPALHITGYILIYLSSCINPIIYVLLNQQYRKAYYKALCTCFHLACCENDNQLTITTNTAHQAYKTRHHSES